MTLKELYALMGGNYDQAVKVMRSDRLIDRYVRRLGSSGVYEQLTEAAAANDATGLYESSHAMKGVCANLGLDSLASLASDICEEFRPGNPSKMSDAEVEQKVQELGALYQNVMSAINQYEGA